MGKYYGIKVVEFAGILLANGRHKFDLVLILKDFHVTVEYAARCYFPVWFKIKAGSSIDRQRAVPQALGNLNALENEWKAAGGKDGTPMKAVEDQRSKQTSFFVNARDCSTDFASAE